MEKRIYFKGLDALRFFAFFLVFCMHAFGGIVANKISIGNDNISFTHQMFNQILNVGTEGVHIFFVLSGFLITYLMIQEEKMKGKIHVGFFYLRRVLRIWPLYYFVMVIGIFVLPQLLSAYPFNASIVKNLLFMNNFDTAELHVGIAWSVAIEEQFYLVWPLIFTLIKNKKHLLFASFILFVFSTIYIICTPFKYDNYHTFANLNYLMTGCMGAILFSTDQLMFARDFIGKPIYAAMMIILGMVVYTIAGIHPVIFTLSLIVLPLVYLFIILHLISVDNFRTSISFLGKYTYGMYLYHPLVLIMCKVLFDLFHFNYLQSIPVNLALGCLALIFTICISMVSYELVEKRFLKLKDHFSLVKTRV